MHIYVERANGGGAVAYLMNYAFKPPKSVSIDVEMQRKEDAQGRDVQLKAQQPPEQQIRNDLLT